VGVGLRQSTSDDVVKPTERFTAIDIASDCATQETPQHIHRDQRRAADARATKEQRNFVNIDKQHTAWICREALRQIQALSRSADPTPSSLGCSRK
jgi:hypothetical protein